MKKNNEILHEVVSTRKGKKGLFKKLTALGLATLLSANIFITDAHAATQKFPDVLVNDTKLTYTTSEYPFYDENAKCTYIPLKSTLTLYGYSTYWNGNVLESGCEYGTLKIEAGQKSFVFNGTRYEMPAELKMVNGIPYVPVVVISTVTNAKTEWNNETYRINFVTNEKKVDEQRLTLINSRIQNNSDLTYSEKQLIKNFVKDYIELMDPTLDEIDDILETVSKLDVITRYSGSNAPVYTIKNGEVIYNGSKSSKVSREDALRNALCYMFNPTSEPLFNGVNEIVSAELNEANTNQHYAMVSVAKMVSDIVGEDVLLKAYRYNNMDIIKEELMSIYNDEALYNNFIKLLNNLQIYDNAYYNGTTISKLSKSKQERLYKEDAMNIYGILDVYYQCKFGYEIIDDDVMEGYYNELLTHGDKKSFKYEPRVFIHDRDEDYTVIYRTPQTGYRYGTSSYNYYETYRPTNYKGNGQVLELK